MSDYIFHRIKESNGFLARRLQPKAMWLIVAYYGCLITKDYGRNGVRIILPEMVDKL